MDDTKFVKYKIKLALREQIEPEEIFFDQTKLKEFEDEKEPAVGKFETPISPLAFRLFSALQIASLTAVGAATSFMIFFKGEDYTAQAQANTLRVFPIFSSRGTIFSADGEILAQNESYFDLLINFAQLLPDETYLAEIAHNLGAVLQMNEQAILEKLHEAARKRFSEYVLLKGISKNDLHKLENIVNNPLFEIKQAYRRKYADGEAFSHIIGYTGEATSVELKDTDFFPGERVGKAGIEAFYDNVLRGEKGILIKKVNSQGEVFSQDVRREATSGGDVKITLYARLQREVDEALRRHVKLLKITSAIAIILDPKSGAILSLVSLPSFDANLFEGGIKSAQLSDLLNNPTKPLFNRAIAGEYPSGSTIKPIIAAAALEEELITPDFLVYSGGAISVPSVYNSDVVYEFKDWKAHGWSDLYKAISDSVNIYFYTIGGGYRNQEGLGIKKIEDYLRKFGWGDILGVDIPGERSGLIPSPKWKKETKSENWYIGDIYLATIGQGDILVTPLQVAAATAVFANGGTLFAPHFVENQNNAGKIIRRNFVSAKNIDVVRKGMRRVITSGSGRFLLDSPYTVAGKTGTAQTARARNHAWFTGFAPYEDPEVVITVFLEEGDSSNYAVRAAKDILDVYFKIFYPQDVNS